jgi:hypothetical protein
LTLQRRRHVRVDVDRQEHPREGEDLPQVGVDPADLQQAAVGRAPPVGLEHHADDLARQADDAVEVQDDAVVPHLVDEAPQLAIDLPDLAFVDQRDVGEADHGDLATLADAELGPAPSTPRERTGPAESSSSAAIAIRKLSDPTRRRSPWRTSTASMGWPLTLRAGGGVEVLDRDAIAVPEDPTATRADLVVDDAASARTVTPMTNSSASIGIT